MKYIIKACENKYNIFKELESTFDDSKFEIIEIYKGRIYQYTPDELEFLKEFMSNQLDKLQNRVLPNDELYIISCGSTTHNIMATSLLKQRFDKVKMLVFDVKKNKYTIMEL